MKKADPSHNKSTDADWQPLGELNLSIDVGAGSTIRVQLAEILGPLNLPADFMNKVLRSAQEMAGRGLQVEAVKQVRYIHLLVFASAKRVLSGHNWGFFRIEKAENAAAGERNPDLTIEFYLYQEGA